MFEKENAITPLKLRIVCSSTTQIIIFVFHEYLEERKQNEALRISIYNGKYNIDLIKLWLDSV